MPPDTAPECPKVSGDKKHVTVTAVVTPVPRPKEVVITVVNDRNFHDIFLQAYRSGE
jgi:hypothetical protein